MPDYYCQGCGRALPFVPSEDSDVFEAQMAEHGWVGDLAIDDDDLIRFVMFDDSICAGWWFMQHPTARIAITEH
jgi:hypothetical protein